MDSFNKKAMNGLDSVGSGGRVYVADSTVRIVSLVLLLVTVAQVVLLS